ncbi:tetraacyldisaccharide 4'-kinase [Leptospira sarikeiensis]|uniref:Tetraacyldisaccharide 4'-kinase n=1 Tax=Leptospira sarikeiensis TaxID=2484943 RepID=A0A4R9KC59_9LEPT|nr:tetraacyldisaccharide 4'-kinase [Leptospira sarikeiensis]TGL63389.1 tetraacyldisaccharide 4'-kinase [Leptospira sarikeiensis]
MILFLKILFFPILFPLSLIYRILFFLDRSLKKKNKLHSAITISVGNFSVGGTGKTPFILHLSQLLHSHFPDLPIVILTRGYGSSGTDTRKVNIDSSPTEVGDEPLLLKKNLPFAEVYVGRNRFGSYLKYRSDKGLSENKIVFALLDDGFQHHALERDLDLVLLDCTRLSKIEFLLPLGLLRESYRSVSRADFLIASKFKEEQESKLSAWLQKYKPNKYLKFRFSTEELIPIYPGHSETLTRNITGKSIYAFSGLGNPEPFYSSLKEKNPHKFNSYSYPDHHSYTKEDLSEISQKGAKDDYIICTEKDGVKISALGTISGQDPSKWFYLRLKTILENESELLRSIRTNLYNHSIKISSLIDD